MPETLVRAAKGIPDPDTAPVIKKTMVRCKVTDLILNQRQFMLHTGVKFMNIGEVNPRQKPAIKSGLFKIYESIRPSPFLLYIYGRSKQKDPVLCADIQRCRTLVKPLGKVYSIFIMQGSCNSPPVCSEYSV